MMTDDLARITEDDQAAAFVREQRKRATAIAGDVAAYHAALPDTMPDDLRDYLTRDFGGRWHALQLDTDVDIEMALLYAEDGE